MESLAARVTWQQWVPYAALSEQTEWTLRETWKPDGAPLQGNRIVLFTEALSPGIPQIGGRYLYDPMILLQSTIIFIKE